MELHLSYIDMKKPLSILVLTLLFSTNIYAIEKKKIINNDEWSQKINTLKWYNDEKKDLNIKIPGTNVNIKIYENETYLLGEDIEQYEYWTFGKSSRDSAIKIFANGYSYIIPKPTNDGYIKIDDWSDVNPEKLIQGLRDANKKISDDLNYAKEIQWIYKPSLDKEKNLVNYSYKVIWDDNSASMETINIILGRKGFVEQTFVFSDLSDTQKNAKFAKIASTDVTYDEGSAYNNYKSGDKIAVAGIGALVATTLGVKALKGGAAAGGILLLVKKLWWLILAPLVFIGKLFGGGDENKSEKSSKSIRRSSRKKED